MKNKKSLMDSYVDSVVANHKGPKFQGVTYKRPENAAARKINDFWDFFRVELIGHFPK